jgi:hypothetical protein
MKPPLAVVHPRSIAVGWGFAAGDDRDEADKKDHQDAAADEQHKELASGEIHIGIVTGGPKILSLSLRGGCP